ncbi:hypothetical protein [Hymenobacter metallilatus]|uniref:Uncharacterized protein n=1 Tax=Hymenobacter metallilatus TaxID=2493666 RepID=A0A3R9NDZ6_9BACT|nr:hypothetical protein [Hymenobacter metallilatus]RSK29850.1 hypothetical protein EI290_16065 [Hymenobacter metallilatus]
MVSYSTPTAPTLPNPVGLDAEIQRLQLLLAQRLTWLQVSYGKAFRHSEKRDGKTVYLPKVYAGAGEYRDVLPNDNVQAQGFFLPRDPAVTDLREPTPGTLPLTQGIEWIFWGNLQRIFSPEEHQYDGIILQEVLRVFTGAGTLVQRVYTSFDEVFRGFTTDLVAAPVLQHPYAGFRIQLELHTPNVLC